jgi:hypothetical protein
MLAMVRFDPLQQNDLVWAGPLPSSGLFYTTVMLAPAAIAPSSPRHCDPLLIYHAQWRPFGVGRLVGNRRHATNALLDFPRSLSRGYCGRFLLLAGRQWSAGFWKPLFRRATQLAPVTQA